MSTTVLTGSTVLGSLASKNQRKIDRCQNGVLWSLVHDASANPQFYYSTDDGATWTHLTDTWPGHGINGSIFIDLDDYMHVVVTNTATATIDYVRGTPNAGRTSYTWSSILQLYSTNTINYPDVVAHREGTGWKAHVVTSQVTSTPSNFCNYIRVNITSGGTITKEGQSDIGGGYSKSYDTWPSIDFNHTGDGKTVAGGTPHLYAAWSAGDGGSGLGIRFKKATYSAGAWAWGTEREIDNTVSAFSNSTPAQWTWLNCLFDGTQVIIGGQFRNTGGSTWIARLWQRDAADTTTTQLGTKTLPAASSSYLDTGSMTYNASGNVFLLGGLENNTGLGYYKYDRAANTFSANPVASSSSASSPASAADAALVSFKRGYSNSKIEWIFKDGTPSTWTIKYDSISNISLSRIYKWNVKASVSLSRIYKWNVLATISLSRIFKWNVAAAVTPFTRVFKWNVRHTVTPFTRTFKWNVIGGVLVTRVFKWNVIQTISTSRVFKWNVLISVSPFTRQFKWNVLVQVTKTNLFLWNVYFNLVTSRIFKWNVRSILSISRTFRWNITGYLLITRTFLWRVFRGWDKIPKPTDVWTEVEKTPDVWTEEVPVESSWR